MGKSKRGNNWILDIKVILGCIKNSQVKACSISRVPEKIREAKDKVALHANNGRVPAYIYSPQHVSMGPFHRGARSDLQIMEETKWRYMRELVQDNQEMVEKCSKAIRKIDSVVRASYGDKIELEREELARIMVLDGCFFLELLRRLYDNVTRDPPACTAGEIDPSLDYIDNKILLVLTDLSLLENQIPLVVLTTLARLVFQGDTDHKFPLLEELAKSLFQYNRESLSGAGHLLHLMHVSFPDPDPHVKASTPGIPELKRCATKLQAVGITIKALQNNASNCTGNNNTGAVASTLREFADRFDFNIDFKKSERELIIPPLHIKRGTIVKWMNFIAFEQSGLIEIGYKFTSYAYFFKGLICCVHDIELLKDKKVIIVDAEIIKDEELLTMFQNITTGADQMDVRYSKMCKKLNKVSGNPAKKCWIMWWHYCRLLLAWIRHELRKTIVSFVQTYMGTRWKFIGVASGAVLLILTITQTYYAAIGH